jgi:hypothetical protein
MTFQAYLDGYAAAAFRRAGCRNLFTEIYYNAIAAPAMQNFHE